MKEMMKKVRERREGFTMAELLIVVAIIAVLVAIAIPVFTAQLEKSKESVDMANIRSGYALASAEMLTDSTSTKVWYVEAEQGEDNWQSNSNSANVEIANMTVPFATKSNDSDKVWKISMDHVNSKVVIATAAAADSGWIKVG